jgi:Ca2+-binding RTX toxin-like protein
MNLSRLDLRLGRRTLACCAAVLGALVVAPQAASAAVSCQFYAGVHIVSVSMTAAGESAAIKRNGDGTIAVNGAACGAATVTNTDMIYVTDGSGGSTTVELDARNGSFAPGHTDEGLFGSELAFSIDLGGGAVDEVQVRGESQGSSIALGSQGINLNVDAELGGADADVSLAGVETVAYRGSPADDWASGQGGHGTGQPSNQQLNLSGAAGDDELHGGAGNYSFVFGDSGDDVLIGGAKYDSIEGGPGNDAIDGSGGADIASYLNAGAGVTIDLQNGAPQDTRGAGVDTIARAESVTGSVHDDVLTGDDGDNTLWGEAGNDLLDARGGADGLSGGAGDDLLRGGAGDDRHNGEDGVDAVAYDDTPAAVQIDLGVTGKAQATGGSGAETFNAIEGAIGSRFDDRLSGSAGPDALDGGAGADAIEGREGSDSLRGGAGPDAIDSRDSSADAISCGDGPDNLLTDALDTIAPDCAFPPPTVSGAATENGTDPVPGAHASAAPVLGVSLPRQSLRAVRASGLRAILRCSANCHATATLRADRTTARRLGLSAARRTVGRLAPVALAAGTARSVRIRLNRATRRALRHARAARLVLQARAIDSAGRASAPTHAAVRLRRTAG